MKRQTVAALAGPLIGLAVVLAPVPGALDGVAHRALAILALAVVFWAADVLNPGITAVLCLGMLVAAGVPAAVALSGFATPAFWILVSVLFFGRAMDKTALARRISYRILLTFSPTYAGISLAFLLIGLVLALGIPSMTVRTAIMVPIAWALVQALNLPLPGPGAATILLGTFEMAVLPGCAILTGALWGPYLTGLFQTAGLPLTWLGYARVMALPTIAWCVLLLIANHLVLKPGRSLPTSHDVVRAELRKLGPMSRPELCTAFIIGLSVAAWASQPWHRVPAEAIGMLALAALFATKVLTPPEIGTGISWGLALFVGGMLSVSTVITTLKINAWIGGFIVPAMEPFAGSAWLFMTAMTVAVIVMRFIDPVGFITIAAFFLSLAAFVSSRGIDPLALVGAILLPLHIFWFNYQNIWIVMTEGITERRAYTDRDRLTLATVYFVVTLVAGWLAVGYWRVIGAA